MNDPKYDLLTDSCFFEFLPTDGTADEAHPLTINVIRVLGFHNTTPQITFAYRISQMVNLAAEKTTEEHLAHAVAEFAKAIGCPVDDTCLYIDYDVDPARYVLLAEPGHSLPAGRLPEYARIFEEKLCEANVEYYTCRYDRSIGHPVVLLQQPQTHALWREFKIRKSSFSACLRKAPAASSLNRFTMIKATACQPSFLYSRGDRPVAFLNASPK